MLSLMPLVMPPHLQNMTFRCRRIAGDFFTHGFCGWFCTPEDTLLAFACFVSSGVQYPPLKPCSKKSRGGPLEHPQGPLEHFWGPLEPVSRDSGPVSRGAVGDATPPAKHDVPLQTYRWGLFYAWFLWVVLYTWRHVACFCMLRVFWCTIPSTKTLLKKVPSDTSAAECPFLGSGVS